MLDHYYLNLAFSLALQNEGMTSPNPSVGAVVVRGDHPVGYGVHERAGAPHAEVMALQHAGERARNAVLYSTLEPCSHHGRTPPCVDIIVQSGISRVVYAVRDENPLVDGKGEEFLRSHRVQVSRVELNGITRFYARFFHTFRTGRPYVTAKAAITANGMIGPADRNSRWITGETSRAWAHRLRARSDGIVVGANTVMQDDPQLTVRIDGIRREPARIVIDPRLKNEPEKCSLLRSPGRVVVCCREAASTERQQKWREAGAHLVQYGGLDDLLRSLLQDGLNRLMLEGGQGIFTWFHTSAVVDEYYLMMAPRLLTGTGSLNLLGGADQPLSEARRLIAGPSFELDGDLVIRLAAPGAHDV